MVKSTTIRGDSLIPRKPIPLPNLPGGNVYFCPNDLDIVFRSDSVFLIRISCGLIDLYQEKPDPQSNAVKTWTLFNAAMTKDWKQSQFTFTYEELA